MSIAAIAPEILRQCLGYLRQEDLARASLVCRDWMRPSREQYWGRMGLNIMDDSVEHLAPVLGKGTTIPRKIKGMQIDESDDFEYREAEDTVAWQANLSTVMSHFLAMSDLTISCLDVSQFPADSRAKILRTNQAHEMLIVRWLKVGHPEEATRFMLNQPDITFLGIGTVLQAHENEIKKDGNTCVDKIGTETERNNEHSDTAVSPPPPPGPIVRLDKLRHLCLFSSPRGLAWSHVVPLLAKGALTELKTLVADCHDRDALTKLISAAEPALRSIAVCFNGPGTDIDLSKVVFLEYLSISLAPYPGKEHVLADTLGTVLSAPPSLQHLFLNIGPSTIDPEKQPENAHLQWAALDAALAGMARLCRITVIVILDSSFSMYVGMTNRPGRLVEKWQNDALNYIKTRLPLCDAKGLVEVKNVTGSWVRGAFADYDVPE